MTTIPAAAPAVQLPPPASAGPASPPAPAKAVMTTPSDTVAISTPAVAASATPAEKGVDRLLDEIKTHNDIADARAHFDWTGLAKDIGHAKADEIKAASDAWLRYSTARIGIDLNGSGISVKPDTTTKGPEGAAPCRACCR